MRDSKSEVLSQKKVFPEVRTASHLCAATSMPLLIAAKHIFRWDADGAQICSGQSLSAPVMLQTQSGHAVHGFRVVTEASGHEDGLFTTVAVSHCSAASRRELASGRRDVSPTHAIQGLPAFRDPDGVSGPPARSSSASGRKSKMPKRNNSRLSFARSMPAPRSFSAEQAYPQGP